MFVKLFSIALHQCQNSFSLTMCVDRKQYRKWISTHTNGGPPSPCVRTLDTVTHPPSTWEDNLGACICTFLFFSSKSPKNQHHAKFCKALSQSKIEGLALFPIPPHILCNHLPHILCNHLPHILCNHTRKSKDSSICQALSQSQTILGLHRWKTTSISQKWKTTSIFF